jgi:hypothetical protein
VTFGDKLNTIKNAAFKSTGLEYVYIPGNISIVSNSAFDGCPNLVTVEIEEGVKTLAYRAFAGSKKLANVVVPASVTTLGAGVFRSCYGLESAEVNAAVAMKEDMFFDNRVLTSVTLAEGTPSIDWRAFFKCVMLESIVIQESVTAIGKLAFYNCLSLTEIVIPADVKSIGDNAFENCKALATVYVDSAAVAAGLTSDKAMGQLTRYATTVAFAEGIDAPAYIAENFANVTISENTTVAEVYASAIYYFTTEAVYLTSVNVDTSETTTEAVGEATAARLRTYYAEFLPTIIALGEKCEYIPISRSLASSDTFDVTVDGGAYKITELEIALDDSLKVSNLKFVMTNDRGATEYDISLSAYGTTKIPEN